MCKHGRFIYNRFSHQKIFVRCGKCASCIQEDALRRTNRIRLHQRNGYICLFVTLTYSNDFVPYVLRSDIRKSDFDINIYRNCVGRYVYSKKNGLKFKKEFGIDLVDSVLLDPSFRHDYDNLGLKPLKGLSSDYVGVIYYPDLQNFFKRFRQNYEREFKESLSFDYWSVAEYGGYSYRPHFHILLFVPASFEGKVRNTILKSWPYADSRRTAKFIEVARDAASYVASYVNGHFDTSTCLQSAAFKQKHSQSQNLGVVLDVFSLPNLLEKVDKRDLHYYFRKKVVDASEFTSLLVPKYVINRYFPKFKGVRWFTSDTLRSILVKPETLWDYVGNYENIIKIDIYGYRKITIFSSIDLPFECHYDFGRSEIYSIIIRLKNAQLRFMSETGLNAYDFAYYYEAIWNLYNSSLIGDSLQGVESYQDFAEFYFNNCEILNSDVYAPTLENLFLVSNPNAFKDIIFKSDNLEHTYFLKDKTKKVVNFAMSSLGYEV